MAFVTMSAFVIRMVRTTPSPAVRIVALASANRTQLAIWSMAWKPPSTGLASGLSSDVVSGADLWRRLGSNNVHPLDRPSAAHAPLGVGGQPVCGPGRDSRDGVLGGSPVLAV